MFQSDSFAKFTAKMHYVWQGLSSRFCDENAAKTRGVMCVMTLIVPFRNILHSIAFRLLWRHIMLHTNIQAYDKQMEIRKKP